MASRKLIEIGYQLIRDQIRNNIQAALTEVRTDRGDTLVTTEAPQRGAYFNYPQGRGFKTPALFIIPESMHFNKHDRGANFLSAMVRFNITVVVEDKIRPSLTLKAWRYQAALHKLLDQTTLTSADGTTKLVLVVTNATFTPHYSTAKDPTAAEAPFRQEVVLECEVDHYEAL